MHYKSAIYILFVGIFVLLFGRVCAQEQEDQGTRAAIDSSMAISPDYLPTRLAPMPTAEFNPLEYSTIDTSLVHIAEYDPLLQTRYLYQSLGINGQAHKNMVFDLDHPMGFTWTTLPYPLYFRKMQDLQIYNLATSYTNIDFAYGVLKEFDFGATHAQHVRQADFVFNLDGTSNDGYFIRQAVNRLSLSAIARYETPNKIYGFVLAYIFNHGKFAENGGLENCLEFINRNPRDADIDNNLSSYAVMFSNALTTINTHGTQLLNYVNIKDKQGRYFGTFSHTFDFNYLGSQFTDHDLNNNFYRDRYYINTDTTNDSIRFYSVANSLQWSNYSPVDTVSGQHYSFRIAGGIRHEYANLSVPRLSDNSLTLFARTSIRLFKVWEIFGNISYSFFGYTGNDAMARAGFRFTINPKQRHHFGFEASFNRYAPDYQLSRYFGNNNSWKLDWGKQNLVKVGTYWTMLGYRVSFNFYNLGRFVYLNSHYEPQQLEKAAQIVQFQVSAPLRTKHFALDANLALQHSTRQAVTVPLFAGKLSALYRARIFKKRLQFQVGLDLFYNTPYFADGYNPILHRFYSQQEMQCGNFLYVNAHLALRVKRTAFFVRGGNLIAGLINYRYITTPGYPMQGQNVEVGVNWKFYD